MVFVHEDVGWSEVLHVVGLGGITLARVLLLIGLASLFWVPVAVWIGLRPKYSQKVRPWRSSWPPSRSTCCSRWWSS